MRAIALACLLVVAGAVLGHADATIRDGFDHTLHDRDIAVSGADPIVCAQCHTLKAGLVVGRPTHAACFTTCHGGEAPAKLAKGKPVTVPLALANVCAACHSAASLAAPSPTAASLSPAYPPYTRFQDFALEAGHKTHAPFACAQCHPSVVAVKAPKHASAPHARCATCHDGAGANHGPAMTQCTTCHSPASGVPEPLAMVVTKDTQILTTDAFSHRKHAARGGAGAVCTSCHAEVITTDDRQLPRPKMTSCAAAGCHDGAAAFAVWGPCRQCHPSAPVEKYAVARPTERFSHALPNHQGPALPCARCHTLSARGEPMPPGHASCVGEGCHTDDFGRRWPEKCGACHNGTEPWRPLVADRAPRDHSELGIAMDHEKHPGPCERCHVDAGARGQPHVAVGHAACTGDGCHAASGGVAPALTACEGCHREGLVDARLAARAAAPWSVRATFPHGTHRTQPDGTALACTACHTSMHAPTPLTLPTPGKPTCAPCHDGAIAFKLTGTTCKRCHGGARE